MARQQITIGKKIGSGFAVILLLVVVLAGIYQFALTSATAKFTSLIEQDMAIALHAITAKIALIQCRQNEKLLLYADDVLLTKEANNYIGTFKEKMGTIEALGKKAGQPGLAEAARKLLTLADDYEKKFNDMIAAPVGNERMVSTVAVRQAAQAIDPLLNELSNNARNRAERQTMLAKDSAALQARIALALGAAIMVVGGLMAFFLSRSISRFLRQAVASLSESSTHVASASSQLSSSSQSLAEGSSEQAASLEETSSAMEEMSAMTKRNAENAAQAKSLADRAGASVTKANASMGLMVGQMAEISSMGEEIGKIIKTIDEIAFQTNLLALNAAVEAARAGEAGAGFAVVADEVRNLAQRAAGAAKNTSGLIEGAIRKIKDGTHLVEKTHGDFQEVASSVVKVNELVGEISAASSEQSHGIDEVSTAIGQMDKVTQGNAANAEEIASASEEMNAQALSMEEIVRSLEVLVKGEASAAAQTTSASQAAPAARRKVPLPVRAVQSPAGRMACVAIGSGKPAGGNGKHPGGNGKAHPAQNPEDLIPFEDAKPMAEF